jgi:predicted glycosyltransferase involved in capsule biosynthesis
MPFWTDGVSSDRERNVFFCWDNVKLLNDFLNEKNIKSECRLYDFSPEKIHPESIHIPYELSTFEKSKKLNTIIDDNLDCEYVMFIDSDLFFVKNDFEKILTLINNINENILYTFDCAKLNEEDSKLYVTNQNIDIFSFDWGFAFSANKERGPLYHSLGGLGVTFIVNRNILNNYGRFNEDIKTWGGEDGDSLNRIMINYKEIQVNPVRHFHPFHLYHFTDWGNKKYFNK